jgi:PAS domain S-box-containing protein
MTGPEPGSVPDFLQRIVRSKLPQFRWSFHDVLSANDQFLELVGYSRSDLEHDVIDWDAMTPPEYWSLDETCMLQIIRGSRITTPYVKELFRKDGARITVRLFTFWSMFESGVGLTVVIPLTGEHIDMNGETI